MNLYVANPLSRKAIRDFVRSFRREIGMGNMLYIDIMYIVEVLFCSVLDPSMNFVVAPILKMGKLHGLTDAVTKTITIREDVYDRACQGQGRDRFTVAHELGHYILHDGTTVNLARIEDGASIPAFRNPEWQANAFAGELLIPHDKIKGLSVREIAKTCRVSLSAASLQKQKQTSPYLWAGLLEAMALVEQQRSLTMDVCQLQLHLKYIIAHLIANSKRQIPKGLIAYG